MDAGRSPSGRTTRVLRIVNISCARGSPQKRSAACAAHEGAVGNLRKVVPPELLLLLHAERTMIRRDALQIVEGQPSPELILLRLVAQRRTHHVLGAAEVGFLVVVVGEEQVLGARLRVRRQ